jgi:hypothetical protein
VWQLDAAPRAEFCPRLPVMPRATPGRCYEAGTWA